MVTLFEVMSLRPAAPRDHSEIPSSVGLASGRLGTIEAGLTKKPVLADVIADATPAPIPVNGPVWRSETRYHCPGASWRRL